MPPTPSQPTKLGKRQRSRTGCVTCRARKVKCDERPNICGNCEKLNLTCVQPGTGATVGASLHHDRALKACRECRSAKIRCSGAVGQPCQRCQDRSLRCEHDAKPEPRWISQSRAVPASPTKEEQRSPARAEEKGKSAVSDKTRHGHELVWLLSPTLPSEPRLSQLVDVYFRVMHPLRCFGFIHRPTFMQQIEDQSRADHNSNALLLVLCAIAAKFISAAELRGSSSETTSLHAGSQWARKAQALLSSHMQRPSCESLMATVLLHEHELRVGNYASAFMLTGIAVRLSQALGLGTADRRQISAATMPPSYYESRHRLMWSVFVLDAWVGSGVDELTLIHERNIHVALPASESDFIMDMERSFESSSARHVDLEAQFILLVGLRKSVLRIVKHLEKIHPPWEPGSEWSKLYGELGSWHESLPDSLRFTRAAVQKRKFTGQHGALLFLHLCYHQTMCDLTRIGMGDLFRIKGRLVFPPEQHHFLSNVQDDCFDHCIAVSSIFREALAHGAEAYADTWLCVVAHDASRVQVNYFQRRFGSAIMRTSLAEDVDSALSSNVDVLTRLVPLVALAKPLLQATLKLATSVGDGGAGGSNSEDGAAVRSAPEDVLNPLAIYRMARKDIVLGSPPEAEAATREEIEAETGAQADEAANQQLLAEIQPQPAPQLHHQDMQAHATFPMDLPASFDELQVYIDLPSMLPPAEYGVGFADADLYYGGQGEQGELESGASQGRVSMW